jgi:hypothetical protein
LLSGTHEYKIRGAFDPWPDSSVTLMNVTVGCPRPPDVPEPVIVAPAGKWDRTKKGTFDNVLSR